MKTKLVRITTVPVSLKVLLRQQLRYMSNQFDVLAVSSPGPELEAVQKTEGVRTAAITMTRSITPWQDLKSLWQLYRLLRKEQPSIVHTHTPKAGLLGMLAAKLAGVPVRLHTVAGLPLMEKKGLRRKLLEAIERITYYCATKVYPNSARLGQFLLTHRLCPPSKMQVLGNGSSNGIDTVYFQVNAALEMQAAQLKASYGIQPGDFVFVFIGRLVRDKGMEELVKAFTALQYTYKNSRLLLVGPFEQALDPLSRETLQRIQNDPSIIQVDFQQDVRPWLMMGKALVFPSYREGFPNVPMQAGCLHLPAIVTDINGCNEIVQHGKNGLIIPVKQVAALQEAMEQIMTDTFLYNHLKEASRDMIVQRFDQQQLWQLLLNEYREQLNKHDLVPQVLQTAH